MRAARLMLTPLAAALLTIGVAGCGVADHPRGSTPIGVPPVHHTTPAPPPAGSTPPPATEMSAISRDSQAKLTAEGAVKVVDTCFAKTHDYRRCTTDQPDSQLAIYPAAAWGTDPGQVSIQGTESGYAVHSRSYSGALFVITQPKGAPPRRTCSDSVSECDSGTW